MFTNNMNSISKDKNLDIIFRYQFCSFLGPMEEERYVQKIFVDIVKTDDSGNDVQIIGKASIKIILVAQALDDGYDIYDVFDTDSYTMRIGDEIYDFENDDIKEDLGRQLFGDDYMANPNICIFERLTILPEYRGLGIAAKFIKDNFFFFNTACGLIVMQPFPLQFEAEGTRMEEALRLKEIVTKAGLELTIKVGGCEAIKDMYDARTNLGLEVVEDIRKFFKEKVYNTIIPRLVRLTEAPSHGEPIIVYDPKSRGSEAYLNLAKEVIERNGK